ncbi:hypothetical protein T492DRAFT_858612 [Pavlovales sp. CCMP2436]|nr:hypothetical protein T492DRAFT_858612 [Pavlovales sp. CCMP2436]
MGSEQTGSWQAGGGVQGVLASVAAERERMRAQKRSQPEQLRQAQAAPREREGTQRLPTRMQAAGAMRGLTKELLADMNLTLRQTLVVEADFAKALRVNAKKALRHCNLLLDAEAHLSAELKRLRDFEEMHAHG